MSIIENVKFIFFIKNDVITFKIFLIVNSCFVIHDLYHKYQYNIYINNKFGLKEEKIFLYVEKKIEIKLKQLDIYED